MEQLTPSAEELYNSLMMLRKGTPSRSKPAIVFTTDTREGVIRFWPESIVELSVYDAAKDEEVLWLHFRANDEGIWADNIDSFFTALHEKHREQPAETAEAPAARNIALACTTGMTSSLFAQQLEDKLKEIGRDAKVTAFALDDLMKQPDQFDWILLSTQVGYKVRDVQKKFSGQVMKIDPLAFGTMNPGMVLQAMGEKEAGTEAKSAAGQENTVNENNDHLSEKE